MGFNLLNIYKEEINVFFNKLINILPQNFKYNYVINLKESKILLKMSIYNLL